MKLVNNMIESPLNYTGGKARLLNQILPKFPNKINRFVDLFCGGCNVGLNVSANKIFYNDYNEKVIKLFKILKKLGADNVLSYVFEIIEKYKLSLVSKYGYDYYNCNSSEGVGKYNRDKYIKLRIDYNEKLSEEMSNLLLYVLIVYAFNNQIRFNSKGEFNLPVGKRDFNKKMENKLCAFINKIDEQSCTFSSKDFRKYNLLNLNKDDLVYVDPPYLITCASYNENGGWTENDEKDLLKVLDELNDKKVRFALSNVLKNKGRKNTILNDWIKAHNDLTVHHLNFNYSNCNYHTDNKNGICDEVLIVNY